MATVASPAPPVRTGLARLFLSLAKSPTAIPDIYAARLVAPGCWRLTLESGPRAGTRYRVQLVAGVASCTCPDHTHRLARCKHISGLAAAGLLPEGGAL